ncbi:MAG: carbamoyltransferase HypF, partial [Sandaracinaceae bacterium]
EAGVPSRWPPDAERFRALTATRLARPTSSVGRLFDAVAALSGVCTRSTFEGEAAMRLEALAEPGAMPYPVLVTRTEIDWRPTLAAMARDLEDVASRFHATLVDAIARTTELHGARLVALGGGVFQNARLTEDVSATLQARGVEVLLPELVPPNDGGLALGQAWLASREDR